MFLEAARIYITHIIYALGFCHWGFGDWGRLGGLEFHPQAAILQPKRPGQRFEPPAGRFWRPGRGCGLDGAKFIGRLS